MEGEEGEGLRLSKRFPDKSGPGEVDYKTKSGTAWSHSYLNQKPWHPLSYPNQRRKWIAEQTHAQRERRAEEVSREYAQEQEFFRQAALVSKKEKEKMEMMKAVSFMYVRPPGYNAESAKAAEIVDESKRHESSSDHTAVGTSGERAPEPSAVREHLGEEKKKPRPKDVFGRPLPTEEEFEILKNAPRMETGVPARVKPFGVEVRNVKCLRCGNYGHQSGDRECPLKDAIMPNEQSRLKRDDPLTAIIAHTDPTEPLKWELKQKPGISPPRGGFEPDDPNQQIVAEDIFDEYGGFLGEDSIPNLLTKFSSKPRRKKSSRKNEEKLHAFSSGRKSKYSKENETISSSDEERKPKSKKQHKMKKRNHSVSSPSDELDFDAHHRGRRKHSSRNKQRRDNSTYSSEDSDSEEKKDALLSGGKSKYSRENETLSPSGEEQKPRSEKRHKMKKRRNHSLSSPSHASNFDGHLKGRRKHSSRNKQRGDKCSYSSEDSDSDTHEQSGSRRYASNFDGHHRGRRKHSSRNKQRGDNCSYSSEDSDSDTHKQSRSRRFKRFYSSKGPESDQCHKTKRKHRECSYSSEDSAAEKHGRRDKDRLKHFVSSEQIDDVSHLGSERRGETYYSSKTVDHYRGHKCGY